MLRNKHLEFCDYNKICISFSFAQVYSSFLSMFTIRILIRSSLATITMSPYPVTTSQDDPAGLVQGPLLTFTTVY
jgi:hypothetical protein